MGWADRAITTLKQGFTVTIKPKGNSMLPRIKSGQEVEIEPVFPATSPGPNDYGDPPDDTWIAVKDLKVNDVVLVRVKGNVYLHLIKAIKNQEEFLIGNNKGKLNGWVKSKSIYGRAILK